MQCLEWPRNVVDGVFSCHYGASMADGVLGRAVVRIVTLFPRDAFVGVCFVQGHEFRSRARGIHRKAAPEVVLGARD